MDELKRCVIKAVDWFEYEFGRLPKTDDDFRWVTIMAKQMEECPGSDAPPSDEEELLSHFLLDEGVVEN